jgi:hypothetical protein
MTVSKISALATLLLATSLNMKAAKADGYAGLLLGPSFVDQSYGTRFVVGAHVGSKLNQNFSLGFYGTYQNMGTGIVGPSASPYSGTVKEIILAVESNFYPSVDLPIYFGAKLGLAIVNDSIVVTDGSGNQSTSGQTGADIAVGPAVGVDFPVAPSFSLGAEFNTIFIISNADTLHLINLLGTATFHF